MVKLDACDRALFDNETLDMGLGHDCQIPAAKRRFQKSLGRVPAPARPLVHIEITGPFIVAPVEIFGRTNAGLTCRLLKGIKHIPAHARLLHPPFAAGGMHVALAAIKSSDFRK